MNQPLPRSRNWSLSQRRYEPSAAALRWRMARPNQPYLVPIYVREQCMLEINGGRVAPKAR